MKTPASIQPTNNSDPEIPGVGTELFEAFVAKLSPSGDALVYSTYFGGSDLDFGTGIAVDAQGAAYVVGQTRSLDLPVFIPFQPNKGSAERGLDGFVLKINPSGAAVIYASYLGGNSED